MGRSCRSRGATNPMDCFTNSCFSPMKLYPLQKNHLAPTSFGKWSINRMEKSSYLSRNRAWTGCDRQESRGDGSQTTGIFLFSSDSHCGTFEPHQANKALPTQRASAGRVRAVPSARCEGKESTAGRRAQRFLQKGLDLIKLIFFSNTKLSKGGKTLRCSSAALNRESGVRLFVHLNNRLCAAAGAAHINIHFSVGRCFQPAETINTENVMSKWQFPTLKSEGVWQLCVSVTYPPWELHTGSYSLKL